MANVTGIKTSPVDIEQRKKLGLRAGDTVKVSQRIKEGDKTRYQIFDGLIIAMKHGTESGATFTVRNTVDGVGVERIFPLFSPNIGKIEITRRAKVRRAKLYHVRRKAAKEIRKQMRVEMRKKDDDMMIVDETVVAASPVVVEEKK